MESTPTAVNVWMDMMESTVKTTSMNVTATRAEILEHAKMQSTPTHVHANRDFVGICVESTSMNVHHLPATMVEHAAIG